MSVRVAIGDFSRMTQLSVKALRHYHDFGVLVPAAVDPGTGYRYYDVEQVPVAHIVRRLRDLGMPLADVKAVLQAPDLRTRNEVIVAHLARMETQLARVSSTVNSLRSLLEGPPATAHVRHRAVAAVAALAISESVAMADLETWCDRAFTELYDRLRSAGLEPAGVPGGLFPGELFEVEVADVVVFVPVAQPVSPGGRTRMVEVPGAELAVARHEGPFGELDRTYGALGTYVAQRELAVAGPIREYYPTQSDAAGHDLPAIEVGWPILTTARHSGR
jgi:DNA-binding transcriptional MerR regulator